MPRKGVPVGSSQLGSNINPSSVCNRVLINLTVSVSTTEMHLKYYFITVLIEPLVLHELMSEQIASIKQGSGSTVQLRELKHEYPCKQNFMYRLDSRCQYNWGIRQYRTNKCLFVVLLKYLMK